MIVREDKRINSLNYCASAVGLTAKRTKITAPSEMPITHSTKENLKSLAIKLKKTKKKENKSVVSRLGKVLYILLINIISIRYSFTDLNLHYANSENRKGRPVFF